MRRIPASEKNKTEITVPTTNANNGGGTNFLTLAGTKKSIATVRAAKPVSIGLILVKRLGMF